MTAIVGILNKKGIAIAADSAVTFKSDPRILLNKKGEEVIVTEDKVINSGDKMLRLKDKQPVVIMIVENSHLKDFPWDAIVRWYRKKNDASGFPKLKNYIEDFLAFVEHEVLTSKISHQQTKPTNLVFAGYGENEAYPSICQCIVTGIRKGKLLCTKPNFVTITEENESAIFDDGQPDIIDAIHFGIQDCRIDPICNSLPGLLKELLFQVGILDILNNKINPVTIYREAKDLIDESSRKHFYKRLNDIKSYNLQEMACFAENLIKATELHRKITFQQEGVGGLVDLAIITKNDGFQWLNRKSWYEPSKGGQYGKFGV